MAKSIAHNESHHMKKVYSIMCLHQKLWEASKLKDAPDSAFSYS